MDANKQKAIDTVVAERDEFGAVLTWLDKLLNHPNFKYLSSQQREIFKERKEALDIVVKSYDKELEIYYQ